MNKQIGYALVALIISLVSGVYSASASGHFQHANGHSNNNASHKTHSSGSSSSSTSGSSGSHGTPIAPVVPPVAPPVGNEVRFTAYTTGYAALDNTPRGSTQIDLGGHSGNAGGTGTYADPITLAVGHSIINGKDVGDYPYGTKFYVPNVKKYFQASDSCGDGNSPQNGPCHSGFEGHVWLDLYVGASLQNNVLGCEDSITDLHLVIENPASNYAVVPGAVYDTGCVQYGDTVLNS